MALDPVASAADISKSVTRLLDIVMPAFDALPFDSDPTDFAASLDRWGGA